MRGRKSQINPTKDPPFKRRQRPFWRIKGVQMCEIAIFYRAFDVLYIHDNSSNKLFTARPRSLIFCGSMWWLTSTRSLQGSSVFLYFYSRSWVECGRWSFKEIGFLWITSTDILEHTVSTNYSSCHSSQNNNYWLNWWLWRRCQKS